MREFLTNSFVRSDPARLPHEIRREVEQVLSAGRWQDPEVLESHTQNVLSVLGRDIGIYCLSGTPCSILMWSHYAQDHTGYCIQFEATDTPFFGRALPVLYSEKYPFVDFFNTPNDVQVDEIFLTKYIGWSYEEEYRIIDHENGGGLREYPKDLMKSVIFGLRMPEDDKLRIRKWLSRRGGGVSFYNSVQSKDSFSMTIQKVE
jgi:hypothetical protein